MSKLNLNGIELELPDNATIDISADGTKVKIGLPLAVERIRVVEVQGPERLVETIRIVEVEKPAIVTYPVTYPGTWSYRYYPNWSSGGSTI